MSPYYIVIRHIFDWHLWLMTTCYAIGLLCVHFLVHGSALLADCCVYTFLCMVLLYLSDWFTLHACSPRYQLRCVGEQQMVTMVTRDSLGGQTVTVSNNTLDSSWTAFFSPLWLMSSTQQQQVYQLSKCWGGAFSPGQGWPATTSPANRS